MQSARRSRGTSRRSLLDPPERFLDRLEDLGVGLFQLERDVDFVVAARLVGHVALAGVVVHRRLQRLDSAGAENFSALLEQRILEGRFFSGH